MGGQSTEPRPFLSDKNDPGRINEGSEKSSDCEGDKSGHFSDPLADNHKDTHSGTPAVTVTNRASVNWNRT